VSGTHIHQSRTKPPFISIRLIYQHSLPFRIIPPFFADKFGALNTIGPILLGVALVSWTWLAVHSVGGFYAFTAFYGIINGAFQCLIPTCVASLTPNLNMVGTRLGMAFATVSFAALTGP
jgi:MFS family permease